MTLYTYWVHGKDAQGNLESYFVQVNKLSAELAKRRAIDKVKLMYGTDFTPETASYEWSTDYAKLYASN